MRVETGPGWDDAFVERFWDKVEPEPNTGCWLWSGALGTNGYGNVYLGVVGGQKRYANAHRLADMARKKRSCIGDRNGQAKLDWPSVNAMRAAHCDGIGLIRLSDWFGVSIENVRRIVGGGSWRK